MGKSRRVKQTRQDNKEKEGSAEPVLLKDMKNGRKRDRAEPEKNEKPAEIAQKSEDNIPYPNKKTRQLSPQAIATKKIEFVPETRDLEDLWLSAFPVGIEWDQIETVYKYPWKFTNLEKSFEENGALFGKRVYIFGCTEPQLVPFNGDKKVVQIPVVVVVVSPFPPSDKIGIKSVQMEGEAIIPMKEMKMGWVPYIPYKKRGMPVESLKTQIYTLQCTQRRAALKQLKQERLKKYEYCLPYFYQPLKEDEIEVETIVQIMYPTEPPVVCDYDWEFDEYDEFADNLIKEEALTEEQKEDFMKFVKDRVVEEKKKQRAAREARKKALEEMNPETKAAFENMRFYKYYPDSSQGTPDISKVKVPFINRYYGKAHEVI